MVGEHHGLLPQRRDQAVDLAAVLHALAHRVDVVVVHGAHLVVDHDRPLDGEAAGHRELGVRPDAGRDDDQVAVDRRSRPAAGRRGPCPVPTIAVVRVVGEARRCRAAATLRRRISPPSRPSWAFIRCRPACTTSTCEAVALQAAGRLQAEQAAADHHRPAVVVVRGVVDHRPGVVDGAEREDARAAAAPSSVCMPVHRRHEGAAAGGDDQLVVRGDLAVVGEHHAWRTGRSG